MLFQEFMFKIIVKLRKAHVILDQLSQTENGEKVVKVLDNFPDTTLFSVEAVPTEWYEGILEYLATIEMQQDLEKAKQ